HFVQQILPRWWTTPEPKVTVAPFRAVREPLSTPALELRIQFTTWMRPLDIPVTRSIRLPPDGWSARPNQTLEARSLAWQAEMARVARVKTLRSAYQPYWQTPYPAAQVAVTFPDGFRSWPEARFVPP